MQPTSSTEFQLPRRIHLVGIGGIGMSAIGRVLAQRGILVSGSDQKPSPLTARLAAEGIAVYEGHAPAHVAGADLVVVSSAVPADNPEIVEARRRGIPVIKRAEMLGRLLAEGIGIAIAGTHGKTTTSSMIALMLDRAGLDPTILVGGEISNLGTNARAGHGPYVVAEADEYDGSFLRLTPHLAVITNVEPDHLDFYGDFTRVVEAFRQFANRVPPDGTAVLCADDPQLRTLAGDLRARVVTYALDEAADWRAEDLGPSGLGGRHFLARWRDQVWAEIRLAIPGRHNISNALAAIAVAAAVGVDRAIVERTLAEFRGARRRFDVWLDGAIAVVDDYAHHPTEIDATLRAARERYPGRRIVAVFQPHTYSRTRDLLDAFAECFGAADRVVVTEIYAARERDTLGMSARDLVARMRHPRVAYAPTLDEAVTLLRRELAPGDVVLTLGAGDVYHVAEALSVEVAGIHAE